MSTARFSKWPDYLELTTNEEGQPPSIRFVCERKNSRSFQAEQLNTLRALEFAGKVVVRVGTKDLTLDEFEQQGAFNVDLAPKLIAQSTYYNKRAELKRYESHLRTLDLDDPTREGVWMRVQRLRAALGLEEEGKELDVQFETTKSSFDSLVSKLSAGPKTDYTDAELLTIDWPTLAKIQEPDHTRLWGRKLQLHKEMQHEQQSGVTGQDNVDGKRVTNTSPALTIDASS